MKKLIIISITFVFTFISVIGINTALEKVDTISNTAALSKINLIIDAGHGGIDAGTIGVDGTNEKLINLSIAKKLYDFTGAAGINAALVRDGDYLVYDDNDDKSRSDLYNRMDFVNSINNSTLISIHQNHFENESEWGTQIWYSPNDELSKMMADRILYVIKDNLQKDNKRENKKSDSSYYLLHKAKVPSIMIECGFMSNREENNKLQDNAYQNQMAYSIMLGFSEYISKEL
ncbi:MAG: N-acetylmuramoyl-L-alanine amidase [Clostridium sp.]|nr:N-acetylmuramoyl-L-alanine amidase [Clostridium sp.]